MIGKFRQKANKRRRTEEEKVANLRKRFYRSFFAIIILTLVIIGITSFVSNLYMTDEDDLISFLSPITSKMGISTDTIGEVAGEFSQRIEKTQVSPLSLVKEPVQPSTNKVPDAATDNIDTSAIKGSKTKTEVLKFSIFADIHSDLENINQAIDQSIEEGSIAIFNLGDLTDYGEPQKLKEVQDAFLEKGVNAFFIPGDRDLANSVDQGDKTGLSIFTRIFGDPYGVTEYEGLKFVYFNNSANYSPLSKESMQWLEENITNADFLLLSQPIYHVSNKSMGYADSIEQPELLLQANKILDLVRTEDISLVIAGDHHISSEDIDPVEEEIEHIVVGAISSEINGRPQKLLQSPRFTVVTAYDDGSYSYEEIILN
jgi:predicted phosphodiesterase